MAKRGSVKWSALAAPFEVDRNKTKRVVNLQEVLEQVRAHTPRCSPYDPHGCLTQARTPLPPQPRSCPGPQVFYDPWRPRDDRLGPLVLQAKQRSKGYVSIEAIRGQLPQFTAAQIRTAAMASRQLRLSSDQASVRRVFGSRDDILQYLDHIFGKKKCVPGAVWRACSRPLRVSAGLPRRLTNPRGPCLRAQVLWKLAAQA